MRQPTFEELYVVSDLHIGDTKGAPIFKQATELAELIKYLTARKEPKGTLGLVLNGDVFDTLPEAFEGYVCGPEEAEGIIDRIVSDERFRPVFDALGKFLEQEGRRLIFVLGNHDLELVYPNVQELLLEKLAGASELRRARVTFATLGAGFRCSVGAPGRRSSVVCIHGNELDDWNAVSPETLTRLVRAGTLGHESKLTAQAPNAGTRLVRDVMNHVKRDHPFVDLLKPEIEGVFTVLLALDPGRINALGGVITSVLEASTVGARRVARVLGREAEATEPLGAVPAEGMSWAPGEEFKKVLQQPASSELLDEVWSLDANVREESLAEKDAVLGKGRLLVNQLDYWVRRVISNRREALRGALKDWGGSPETFSPEGACDVFDRLAPMGLDADVVVAGHTHLRRQKLLPMTGMRRTLYLNTGTWIRLLQVSKLNDQFDAFWAALEARKMTSIDELPPEVLLSERTVAVIRPDDSGRTVAAIAEFDHEAVEPARKLTPVLRWQSLGL